MTVDAFAPAPAYTVAGTGPYAVPFDYGQGEIRALVRVGDAYVVLAEGPDYALAPAAPATAGSLTLSAAAAATHAGAEMRIVRETRAEQGWAAQGGAREAGLEDQLDRIIRAVQDVQRQQLQTVRTSAVDAPLAELPTAPARANRYPYFDLLGRLTTIPTATVIGTGADVVFPSVAVVAAVTEIPAAVKAILALGYGAAGDGGAARWARVAAEPAHPGKFRSADRFTSADVTDADNGGWWEIADAELPLEAFGAAGDGVASDSAAFAAAVAAGQALERPVVGTPGHTYRLTGAVPCTGGGVRLLGRGAEITFDSTTDRLSVFEFGDGSAGAQGLVEVSGWDVTMTRTTQRLVGGARFRGLHIERNTVRKGLLLETQLSASSAGFDAPPAWGPDVAAIAEIDLSVDLTVVNNLCLGTSEEPEDGANTGVIGLRFVQRFSVVGNIVRNYGVQGTGIKQTQGIVWTGGDANPERDGGVGSPRWARSGTITGNVVDNVFGGGIWGAQGRDITCSGNVTTRCGDIGVHSEGGLNVTVTGNTMANCKNGGFTPFFVEENCNYSNNVVRIDNAATWGVVLAKNNMAFPDVDFDITMVGNTFIMEDAAAVGQVVFERSGTVAFKSNTLRNCQLIADGTNSGNRYIDDNVFINTRDPGDCIVRVGFNRHVDSTRARVVSVCRNVFEVQGFTRTDATGFIRAEQEGENGFARASIKIMENEMQGEYSSGDVVLPFAADIVTKAGSAGVFNFEIRRNAVWIGKIVDVSHKPAAAAESFNNRVFHEDNYFARNALARGLHAAAPTHGVYALRSTVLAAAPAAGEYARRIVVGTDGVTGGTSGAWNSATAYAVFDHVTGSDDRIYVALVANTNVNPVGGDGTTWANCAPGAATFKGLDLIEA